MRKQIQAAAVLLLLLVLAAAGGLSFIHLYNRPSEGIPGEGAVFHVEEGQSVAEVAGRLESRGLIRSKYILVGLAKHRGTGALIKSGYYRIERGMSTADIHDLLVRGAQTLHKVTVPEGLTANKIAARFEENGICSADDFLEAAASTETYTEGENRFPIPPEAESLQGFLYPDTYLFQREYPAEKVVGHMVEMFFDKLKEIVPDYRELPVQEIYRKVILASIVEREYRAEDEADKIASVFYNRIDRGMRLQSCATVVYVLTRERGEEHPEKLTFDDLEVKSEFNTYTNSGLPPAPISNPGEVALRAAFEPAETDYLYFLVQDPEDGRHTFSRTLSEHNKAYQLYIKQ